MISTNNAVEFSPALLHQLQKLRPKTAIILGSGLGPLAAQLDLALRIPYAQIDGFSANLVEGHQGELLAGELFGHQVLVFSGRFHLYQGLTAYQATAPVRLAAAGGCRNLLLTCAAGGISQPLKIGDFLLVTDHLNFSGISPLLGLHPPRFVDMQDIYRHHFYPQLCTLAASEPVNIHSGVLAYMPGPQYETVAEIAALRSLGADAVGMSTVQEAIMARACHLELATLALITNLAAGCDHAVLAHEDVLDVSARAAPMFARLSAAILAALAPS